MEDFMQFIKKKIITYYTVKTGFVDTTVIPPYVLYRTSYTRAAAVIP